MSKTTMIMLVFGVLVVLYLSLLLWSVMRQQRKMEAFAEKLEETEKDKTAHDENFAEQQLERNLTIINAFEEMNDRKITPEELKEISDLLANEKVLGSTLVKKTLETYKKDKEVAHAKLDKAKSDKEVVAEHFVELAEISSRLSKFVQKVQQHGAKVGSKPNADDESTSNVKVEAFVQGNEPYTHLNKYMPLF